MSFQEKLKKYAEVIVRHGVNVQPGQVVNIGTEVIHKDFAYLLVKTCYEAGAKFVNLDLGLPEAEKVRLDYVSNEDLEYMPKYVTAKYDELLDEAAANIRIIGSENPDLFAGVDPVKLNTLRKARYEAVKRFYKEGIGKSKVQWTLAAAATPAWGKKVFPELSLEEAHEKLWEELFRICRCDDADPIKNWKEHNVRLQSRAKKLTDLGIETLHFIGNKTDLKVGLSPIAVFKGGTDMGPLAEFEPNIPTEECFTTPDWRKTTGKLLATRPFLINGQMIRDLELEFKDGEIISSNATSGLKTFIEYMNSDQGGKRLGEVALVGIDSPIFQSGLVYEEILLDENAACHVAIGSAYKFCLKNGANLSVEELDEVGCNESTVHTDMMISNEKVDVVAYTYDKKKITLIKSGEWQKFE